MQAATLRSWALEGGIIAILKVFIQVREMDSRSPHYAVAWTRNYNLVQAMVKVTILCIHSGSMKVKGTHRT
jgi:hypothetical protein